MPAAEEVIVWYIFMQVGGGLLPGGGGFVETRSIQEEVLDAVLHDSCTGDYVALDISVCDGCSTAVQTS
jgi:hypothetical protein